MTRRVRRKRTRWRRWCDDGMEEKEDAAARSGEEWKLQPDALTPDDL
jgi:hypothetical protein